MEFSKGQLALTIDLRDQALTRCYVRVVAVTNGRVTIETYGREHAFVLERRAGQRDAYVRRVNGEIVARLDSA